MFCSEFDYEVRPGRKETAGWEKPAQPLISIVTGYYNAGEYFAETWNCVMAQTFPWFEWIIVNDGSTRQEDIRLLQDYAGRDSRVRVIQQANGGLSAARNRAIREAKADIVVPLDTDDLIEPTFLEYMYLTLSLHPKAGWCYTDSVGFQDQQYLYHKDFNAEQELKENMLTATAGIRKAMWQDVGGYLEMPFSFNEDWHFWLKCLQKGWVPTHVPEYLFWYRRGQAGMLADIQQDQEAQQRNQQLLDAVREGVDLDLRETPLFQLPLEQPLPALPPVTAAGSFRTILVVPSLTGRALRAADTLAAQGELLLVSLGVDQPGELQQARQKTPFVYCLQNMMNRDAWPWFFSYLKKAQQAGRLVCLPCEGVRRAADAWQGVFGPEETFCIREDQSLVPAARQRTLRLKYGLMIYQATQNLGDDIQSYAGYRFLPRVDYILDREHLNDPPIPADEAAAVIMNGWYMDNKFNWPPSDQIEPLPVAMHFSEKDPLAVGNGFFTGLGGDWLRTWGPVGVRDTSTQKALTDWRIDTWFSGCMTLTLPRFADQPKGRYICAVDVSPAMQEKLRRQAEGKGLELRCLTHDVDKDEYAGLDWDTRRLRVEQRLREYQGAICVITPRLHCALPCLALETPVLLLYKPQSNDSDRLDDYAALVHSCPEEDYLEDRYSYDVACPPENPEGYKAIRQRLIGRVEEFVRRVEQQPTVTRWEYDDTLDRYTWQNRLFRFTLDDGQRRLLERYNIAELLKSMEYLNQLQQSKNWLEEQWKQQSQAKERLEEQWKQQSQAKEWLEEQWKKEKARREELEQRTEQLEQQIQQLQQQYEQLQRKSPVFLVKRAVRKTARVLARHREK